MTVGDRVCWYTKGKSRPRVGEIVYVLPPGSPPEPPWPALAEQYSAIPPNSRPQPRPYESYVVLVQPRTISGKRRLFWPWPTKLRLHGEGCDCVVPTPIPVRHR